MLDKWRKTESMNEDWKSTWNFWMEIMSIREVGQGHEWWKNTMRRQTGEGTRMLGEYLWVCHWVVLLTGDSGATAPQVRRVTWGSLARALKGALWSRGINIIWELLRHANIQSHRAWMNEDFLISSPPGDSDACWSLKTTRIVSYMQRITARSYWVMAHICQPGNLATFY